MLLLSRICCQAIIHTFCYCKNKDVQTSPALLSRGSETGAASEFMVVQSLYSFAKDFKRFALGHLWSCWKFQCFLKNKLLVITINSECLLQDYKEPVNHKDE